MLHLVNLVQQGVQLAEIWSKQNQFSLLLGLQTPSTRAEITCSKPLIVPLQHVGKQIKHAHYEKNHYEFIHARYDKRVPTPHNNLYEVRNQPRVRRHEWFLLPEAIHTISFHGHQHLNLIYMTNQTLNGEPPSGQNAVLLTINLCPDHWPGPVFDIIQAHSSHEWEKNCMYLNVFFPQRWIDPPLWQHNEVEKIVSVEYVTDESCGGK